MRCLNGWLRIVPVVIATLTSLASSAPGISAFVTTSAPAVEGRVARSTQAGTETRYFYTVAQSFAQVIIVEAKFSDNGVDASVFARLQLRSLPTDIGVDPADEAFALVMLERSIFRIQRTDTSDALFGSRQPTFGVTAKIPVKALPSSIDFTPDGRYAFTTHPQRPRDQQLLATIDLKKNRMVSRLRLRAMMPRDVAVDPNGEFVVVASDTRSVTFIPLSDAIDGVGRRIKIIELPKRPTSVFAYRARKSSASIPVHDSARGAHDAGRLLVDVTTETRRYTVNRKTGKVSSSKVPRGRQCWRVGGDTIRHRDFAMLCVPKRRRGNVRWDLYLYLQGEPKPRRYDAAKWSFLGEISLGSNRIPGLLRFETNQPKAGFGYLVYGHGPIQGEFRGPSASILWFDAKTGKLLDNVAVDTGRD